MAWHRDVIMTLFIISETICPNYLVFVLNLMFSGSRISKKIKPSLWRVPWRLDGTLTSSWHSSTFQEQFARITGFCFVFNISGTICPNLIYFVLNHMFSGSRISKIIKPSSWRVPWLHDGKPWRHHIIVQHLRNYLPEFDIFCVESYVLGVKDFEKNKAIIVTCTVTLWRDTMTSSWHSSTSHPVMISRYTSRKMYHICIALYKLFCQCIHPYYSVSPCVPVSVPVVEIRGDIKSEDSKQTRCNSGM